MPDRTSTRLNNSLAVMKAIDRHLHATSTVISRDTGLSPSTVSRILASLRAQSLILQSKAPNDELGRNPERYDINPNYGYYVYAHLSVGSLRCYLLGFDREVIFSRSVPVDAQLDTPALSDRLCAFIDLLLRETLIDRPRLLALAVSLPGAVDRATQSIHSIPNFPLLENSPLAQCLKARTGLPCFIRNSAQLCALGAQLELAPQAACFAYIDISYDHGIGGGIVMGRELFAGAGGIAGEVGDMIVDLSGCAGGQRTTLEHVSSIRAVLNRAEDLLQTVDLPTLRTLSSGNTLTLELLDRAAASEPTILHLLDSAAAAWAATVINIACVLSPDIIMIGGALTESVPRTRELVLKHVRSLYPRPIDVRFSPPGAANHLTGAARIFRQYLYEVVLSQKL